MADPVLDSRSADQFYLQTLHLAEAYCPGWRRYWPEDMDAQAVAADPGLVLLKLFSLLAKYIADTVNQLPAQRRFAFFKFLNLAFRPPLPAETVLAFTLQSGQPPRLVPAGTAVLDAAPQDIRFQTDDAVTVIPAELRAALSILPSQDQFVDGFARFQAGQAAPIFVATEDDPAEQPLGHWLLLGDPTLFKPDPALQSIRLELTGAQLHPAYFEQWFDGALKPLHSTVTPSLTGRSLSIELIDLPSAPTVGITELRQALFKQDGGSGDFSAAPALAVDEPAYWLLVKPAPLVRIVATLSHQLPVITGLLCIFTGRAIQPQQTTFNMVALNIANGAYPFGETPAIDDAFYIRSDNLFARQGAEIKISFVLRDVAESFPATLDWQYWDGAAWRSLNATPADISLSRFIDTTSNLQRNAADGDTFISFVCPAIRPVAVAGSKGLWIRAVVAAGGYGQTGAIVAHPAAGTIDSIPGGILTDQQKQAVGAYLAQAGTSFSYQVTPTTWAPPFIRSLQLGYRFQAVPGRLWCYNAFQLDRFLFNPYLPITDGASGFYFGFAPEEFAQHSLGRRLTLFFDLGQEQATPGTALSWSAFDGTGWLPLDVDDGTSGLARSGIASLIIPSQMQARALFSQTLFWFRIEETHPPRIVRARGIHPNAVWASNKTGVDQEILGSSNDYPSQTFSLSHTPVLAGVTLEVVEPRGLEPIDPSRDPDTLTVTPPDPEPGSSDLVARPWSRVDSFAFCGPTDRVYTLNSQNGLITFGDGRNGMIPPSGTNNIIASHYDYTQGLGGNVPAGALTVLRPGLSDIQAVRNPAPALGGVDGDDLAVIDRDAPALVRTAQRAVELEEFATLAAAASPRVSRAQAGLTDDRQISIAILPESAAPVPYAPPALLNEVTEAVKQGCLATLAERITVHGPDYLAIDVAVQLRADVTPDRRLTLQQTLADKLSLFFQPVLGGPDGQGWQFGETLSLAAVGRFLRGQPGITGLLGLSLNGREFDIGLAPGQLPIAGRMSVLVYPVAP
jgi:hypothetical protein